MYELNYMRLYEIDITPNGATRTYVRLGGGLTGADPSQNEEVDQTGYLDGDGFKESRVTGKQLTISYSGHRKIGDAAQDYIAALEDETGDALTTNFRMTDAVGNVKSGPCTLANIKSGGGDAGAKVEFTVDIHLNGKPARTPHSVATALSATVAPGTGSGCTKFTVTTPGADNILAYKLKAATQGTVYGNSYASEYTTYTNSADIPANAGQYLCMYEIDPNKRVVKYLEQLLDSADFPA